jgi:hypothetical protein
MPVSTRRLPALALLGAALSMTPADAPAQDAAQDPAQTATGRVFLDANANGVLDAGERGVAGVAVTNGLEVIATDADGRYELPVAGDTVIRITKPAGYAVPTDADGLPQFFYTHDPEGSPEGLRYPGMAPTGPLPDRIDFPLRLAAERQRFKAILISDPQPQSDRELDYIRDDLVAELIGSDAAFGLTTGDIMFDDLSLLPRYNALIGQIGVPWWNVPGNHELNFLADDDAHSTETFKRVYGPTYYSFDYGQVHFVVLDNVDYQGRNAGRETPRYRGSGVYEGRIGARQMAWLRNDLAQVAEDTLIFVATHIPLETYLSDRAFETTADRRQLFDILEAYPNLYSVAGHTHTAEHHYFDADDGFDGATPLHHHVLATVSGSWWSGPKDAHGVPDAVQRDGTPNGYYILEVDGTDARLRFKAAGQPADRQMRILVDKTFFAHTPDIIGADAPGPLLDGTLRADQLPAADLLVNLFDGGPRSEVAFRVGDGAERAMRRVSEIDLHANALFRRNPDRVKPWVEAVPSSHLWRGDLPADLAPGVHTVTVRAVDEFGRTHRAYKVLEVLGTGAR